MQYILKYLSYYLSCSDSLVIRILTESFQNPLHKGSLSQAFFNLKAEAPFKGTLQAFFTKVPFNLKA